MSVPETQYVMCCMLPLWSAAVNKLLQFHLGHPRSGDGHSKEGAGRSSGETQGSL